jgi:F-type H+-transporting ATPase subunit b
MQFDWSTLALQTINFAILVWLLHRFLYKPVLRLLDARRAEIDKQYAEAHAAEAQAKDQLAATAADQAGIAAERAAAMAGAAADAEKAAAARHAQAEHETAALLDESRKILATERIQALAEARRCALDLGADIAARLLAETPTKLRAEAWIESIERYLAGLSSGERNALGRQVADGAKLTVTTASALPAGTADDWCGRLHRALGGDVPIDFAVDPALIGGAELHFPNAVLRFSWQSVLAAMRTEIEADGDAR